MQSLASGVEALRDHADGLYQSVGETFTTPGGYELPRAEALSCTFAASQRIADTTQQLPASSTDAETQKPTGVLRREERYKLIDDNELLLMIFSAPGEAVP